MTALVERPGTPAVPQPRPIRGLVVVGAPGAARGRRAHPARRSVPRRCVEAAGAPRPGPAPGTGPRDLCVVEVGLPDGSGIALMHELRAAGWARTVVISASEATRTPCAPRSRPASAASSSSAGRGPGGPRPVRGRSDGVRRPVRPRDRGPAAGRRRPVQQGHRRGAGPVRADREEPPGPDRPQARHRRPRRDGRDRAARRRHRADRGPAGSSGACRVAARPDAPHRVHGESRARTRDRRPSRPDAAEQPCAARRPIPLARAPRRRPRRGRRRRGLASRRPSRPSPPAPARSRSTPSGPPGYRYGQRAYLVQLRRERRRHALIDPVGCPT